MQDDSLIRSIFEEGQMRREQAIRENREEQIKQRKINEEQIDRQKFDEEQIKQERKTEER